jgi:hypothetical protein
MLTCPDCHHPLSAHHWVPADEVRITVMCSDVNCTCSHLYSPSALSGSAEDEYLTVCKVRNQPCVIGLEKSMLRKAA